jgi:hypothetical protein
MTNTNENVFSMLNSFIDNIRTEKKASEPTTALYAASPAAAGLTSVVEGARAKEQTSDMAGYGISDSDTDPKAKTDVTTKWTIATGDADKAPSLNPKAQPGDKDVFGKAGSLLSLGETILNNLSKQANTPVTPVLGTTSTPAPVATEAAKPAEVTKTAAEAPVTPVAPVAPDTSKVAIEKADSILKLASLDADLYTDFIVGYATSITKKANEGAMAELGGATDAAGLAPEAVAATMGNEGGDLSPEILALLDEAAKAGISPEELIAAIESSQGGAEAPAGDAAVMAEAMPQEAVDVSVAGANKIAAAAKILGIAPDALFNNLFKKG